PRNGLRLGEFGSVVNNGPAGVTIEGNDFDHAYAHKALINNINSNATLICNWHGTTDVLSTLGYGNGTGTFDLVSYADDDQFSNCVAPIEVTLTSATHLDCPEDNDGSIDITITGGTSGLTISWTGPGGYSSAVEDPSGLAAGSYDVTVTDGISTASLNVVLNALDDEDPVIVCPGNITLPTDFNSCVATGAMLDPGMSDNCMLPSQPLSFVLSG